MITDKPTYFFKHILFLDHDTSVCYQPELLNHAFVYIDFEAPGSSCTECLEILKAHNKRDLDKEILASAKSGMISYIPETYSEPVEPISFPRALMYAAGIAFVVWLTLILLLRYGS